MAFLQNPALLAAIVFLAAIVGFGLSSVIEVIVFLSGRVVVVFSVHRVDWEGTELRYWPCGTLRFVLFGR
ncbi:MAG: hypothetical protein WDZ52_00455 [Pseudohongiellaceae bacterium]